MYITFIVGKKTVNKLKFTNLLLTMLKPCFLINDRFIMICKTLDCYLPSKT